MRRKLLLFFTLVLLTLTVPLAVFAESTTTKADILNQAGLFKGTDKGYELEKEANRTEALIMLIRLLGEEDAAISSNFGTSFNDVPKWATAYVGYAERTGLTTGIGNGKFGASLIVKPMDYATFILRGLGYSDKDGDFTWQTSLDKLSEIGVLETATATTFNRGTMAEWSYDSLMANIKGTDETLIQKLGLGDVCTVKIKKENYRKPSGDIELCAKFDFDIPKEYNYHDYYIMSEADTAKDCLQGAMSDLIRFFEVSDYEGDNSIEIISSYHYGGAFIKQVDEFPFNYLLILDGTEPYAICIFKRNPHEDDNPSYRALLLKANALGYPNTQKIAEVKIEYSQQHSLISTVAPSDATGMVVFSNLSDYGIKNALYDESYCTAITVQHIIATQKPAFDRHIIYYGDTKNSLYINAESIKQAGATEIYVAFTDKNNFVIAVGRCEIR